VVYVVPAHSGEAVAQVDAADVRPHPEDGSQVAVYVVSRPLLQRSARPVHVVRVAAPPLTQSVPLASHAGE
jgi:hypothetical protein